MPPRRSAYSGCQPGHAPGRATTARRSARAHLDRRDRPGHRQQSRRLRGARGRRSRPNLRPVLAMGPAGANGRGRICRWSGRWTSTSQSCRWRSFPPRLGSAPERRGAATVRVRGRLTAVEDYPKLSPSDTREIVDSSSPATSASAWRRTGRGLRPPVPGHVRFRVNAYYERGATGEAFRLIPVEPTSSTSRTARPGARAHVPPARPRARHRPDRLGQGHVAGGDDRRDQHTRGEHIMTIEDPIEFLQGTRRPVNEREPGPDAHSFAAALAAALREDPDVILSGRCATWRRSPPPSPPPRPATWCSPRCTPRSPPRRSTAVIDVFPPTSRARCGCSCRSRLQGIMPRSRCRPPRGSGRVVAPRCSSPTRRCATSPRGQVPPDRLGPADQLLAGQETTDASPASLGAPQDQPEARRNMLLHTGRVAARCSARIPAVA